MTKLIWIVVIAILVIGGIWYLSGFTTSSTSDATVENQPITTQENPPAPVSGVKEFTVTGSNFAFSPSTITVNKGDTVKIIFNNDDGTHDWKVDKLGVATKKLGTGESETVEFVADKAGTFEYYCSVGQHRAMGMKGTLVVK
ncbi:MAG TPA: cupredoxin domain-containing protein [Candidatus Paceibacterota bacterium]